MIFFDVTKISYLEFIKPTKQLNKTENDFVYKLMYPPWYGMRRHVPIVPKRVNNIDEIN